MPRPTEVKPRAPFCLWLRFDDGTQGEIDLSDLAGRGVLKAWSDAAFFGSVCIAEHGALAWGETIELCPDAVYLRLTGKSPDQLFPNLVKARLNA